MPPRARPANLDDIAELKAQLQKEIQTAKSSLSQGFEGKLAQTQSNVLNRAKEMCEKTKEDAVSESKKLLGQLEGDCNRAMRIAVQNSTSEVAGKISAAKQDTEKLLAEVNKEIDGIKKALDISSQRSDDLANSIKVVKEDLEKLSAHVYDSVQDLYASRESVAHAAEVAEAEAIRAQSLRSDLEAEVDSRKLTAEEIRGDISAIVQRMDIEAQRNHSNNEVASSEIVDLQHYAKALSDTLDCASKLPIRKVEWRIALSPAAEDKEHLRESFISPPFNMGGLRDLQLEFQLKYGADGLPNASAFLWGSKGLIIIFRLSVQKMTRVLEKKFLGSIPHGCSFGPMDVNQPVVIGLEILEARYHWVEKFEDVNPSTTPNAATLTRNELEFNQHINNNLLEHVQASVDLMRSRLVKRVEWKPEGSLDAWLAMKPGQCWQSVQFALAGVEKIQFRFYPNGQREGPEATKGMCALVVVSPPGSRLTGTLMIGAQKRMIDHTFDRSGTFCRHNFCRLDTLFNLPEVIISLDVQSALQELVKSASNGCVKVTRATHAESLSEVMRLPSIWKQKKAVVESAYEAVENKQARTF